MIMKVCQVGEPVLRKRARALSVDEIRSDFIQNLIEEMRDAMRAAPGVGLAAPQVGQSLQLVVIEDQERYMTRLTKSQLTERERVPIDFHVLINPQLTVVEEESAVFFEGCLSLAGFMALVPRARSVLVKALNERAEPVDIATSGWYARILQHEIDHLNGVIYIDRMYSKSFSDRENFELYWNDMAVSDVLKASIPT